MSTVLKTNQLCWNIDGKSILKQLNISIKEGAFVGVIGPNGAGKSSLLRCLYRKNKPTLGTIDFYNKSLSSYPHSLLAQQIAVVLQEPPMQFNLTVEDVIRMGLIPNKALLSFDDHNDLIAIQQAADQVDLAHKLQQGFNSLSGGEKQRAMIARAILQKPKLLIMDEPTNHLDISHQLDVLQLATSMKITVLLSIHDLNLAATFCNHLILLDQGQLIVQGTPEQVLTESVLKQVFGVNSMIDQHPFTGKLRINFDLCSQKKGRG